jgi:hypothetical protein
MKNGLKFGFIFALLWVICKMTFYYTGMSLQTYEASALINNFFLLCAISVGLYIHIKKNNFAQSPFLSDVKQAVVAGFSYTIVVSMFAFFYYSRIDPHYLDKKIAQRMEIVKKALDTDKELADFKHAQPAMELLSREEIYAHLQKSAAATLSPKVAMVIMLLGFTLLSFLYSILIAFFFRKILLRGLN